MESEMFIPTKDCKLDITPTEFEKESLNLLNFELNGVQNLTIEHNQIEKIDDDNYQLDGKIEFEIMGVKYKTIVECKYSKNPIKRDAVLILKSKIDELGFQKGIIISTNGFQSGAISYASKHGIALMQIINSNMNYHTRSLKLNVILNSYSIPSSKDKYTFVLQSSYDVGINCKYITKPDETLLKELTRVE